MVNLLKNSYNAISTNYVICIDITALGAYGELFLMLDLASRCVVGHCYSQSPLDTEAVLSTIDCVIRKRDFLPKIYMIHSDRSTLFKNKLFEDHLSNLNILVSRGSSAGHDNQVVERLNRTIKESIRTSLDNSWRSKKRAKEKDWDPLEFFSLDPVSFGDRVKICIETYNSKPHSAFKNKSSPNEMEEALFLKHKNQHPNIEPKLCETISPEMIELERYQRQVLDDYKGDWQAFFISWRQEQLKWQEETAESFRTTLKELGHARKELEESNMRYQSLYEQYQEIQRKLDSVYEESERKKKEEVAKLEERLKRKTARKQKLRETITPEEFEQTIGLVQGRSKLSISRRRIALYFLYVTGLRVSNLLLFTVRNVTELEKKGSTVISLIKGGESRFKIHIGKEGRRLLKNKKFNFLADIRLLSGTKAGSSFFFSAPKDETIPFDRSLFDRELNKVLQKASVLFEKHLRTHSFRASVITDLLVNCVPIDEVKELIGHRSIATTLEYKRSRLSDSQILEILSQRTLRPSDNFKPSPVLSLPSPSKELSLSSPKRRRRFFIVLKNKYVGVPIIQRLLPARRVSFALKKRKKINKKKKRKKTVTTPSLTSS